jgi:GPH family glycoside/pentoside/hexuronide:cation symporter
MSNTTSTSSGKVPIGQKIAFGLGMLANQMFPAALGIFTVVLVEKLGFSGLLLGLTYFIPKFYDALFDLIMGYVSDNTKSKWGRRRQYVLAGAVILGISFALMWQLYAENGVTYNFWYFLVVSLIFYSGLTIFSIPYVAMGYEMSDDFHERTNIMATSQLIGQLAWVVAPWFWVIMADQTLYSSSDVAVRTLAVYVAIGCAILAAIPAFFIPSKSTVNENYSPIDFKGILGSFGEIKEGLKASIEIKPFRKICIATFLIFNAFQTTAGFSYFIIKYYLFKGNEDGFGLWPTLFGSVGAIITTVAVIPIVARMSKTMGKKKAFLVSQGISVVGYILLYLLFVPGKPYLFLFALPFFSFGIGSLFTLMMSMTSDVIDIDELNTGKRREGSLGAIYWWMVKFGTAVAGLLSGLILSLVAFQSNAATQTDETMFWLRIFFVGIPILGTLTAIWAMKDYDIDEAKAREVRDLLDKRKGKTKVQSSAYLSGKLVSL